MAANAAVRPRAEDLVDDRLYFVLAQERVEGLEVAREPT
jgi:hypothetical protein